MTSAHMRGPPLRAVNGRDLWTDPHPHHHHHHNLNHHNQHQHAHRPKDDLHTVEMRYNHNNHNYHHNGNKFVGGSRPNIASGKRKSAVELLQETKAFYVKSELVRDRKQELRPTRSPDSCTMIPPQPAKSPRCSSHNATTELQNRLRLLLDFDSKENYDNRYNRTHRLYGEGPPYRESGMTTCYSQHKSLPDLHLSPQHSDSESSDSSYGGRQSGRGDARSLYSNNTQHGGLSLVALSTKSSDDRRGGYMFNNSEFTVADPRLYASLRVTKSGEALYPLRSSEMTQSQSVWRRNSNTSSGNRSLHNTSSSRHSQSADSGRLSQVGSSGLRTGKSGLPEVLSPPPAVHDTTSDDSGAEDGSPPLYRSDSYERRRPVLRSKSDTSHRYGGQPPLNVVLPPPPPQNLNPPLMALTQLERFFNNLGMDPASYRELACGDEKTSLESRSSSPVFFSSVSSMDSYTLEQQQRTCWTADSHSRGCNPSYMSPLPPPVPEPWERPCEPVMSVVERNARIIKWLCACRKAQLQQSYQHRTTTGLTLV